MLPLFAAVVPICLLLPSDAVRFTRTQLRGTLVPTESVPTLPSTLNDLKADVKRLVLDHHGGQGKGDGVVTGTKVNADYKEHCVSSVNQLSLTCPLEPTGGKDRGRAELHHDELKFDSAVLTSDGQVAVFFFELDESIHPPGVEGVAPIAFFFERKNENSPTNSRSSDSTAQITSAADLGEKFSFLSSVPSVCDLGLETPGGEKIEPLNSKAEETAAKVLQKMFEEAQALKCMDEQNGANPWTVHKILEHTLMVVSEGPEHKVIFSVKDSRATETSEQLSIQKGSLTKSRHGGEVIEFDIPIGTKSDSDDNGEEIPSACLMPSSDLDADDLMSQDEDSAKESDEDVQRECQEFFLCKKKPLMSGAPVALGEIQSLLKQERETEMDPNTSKDKQMNSNEDTNQDPDLSSPEFTQLPNRLNFLQEGRRRTKVQRALWATKALMRTKIVKEDFYNFAQTYPVTILPAEYDPRKINPECFPAYAVKDQGTCGSCWANSVQHALADRACMRHGSTIIDGVVHSFSVQEMMQCSDAIGDGSAKGCGGWGTFSAMKWAKNGISLEAKYPYKSMCGDGKRGVVNPSGGGLCSSAMALPHRQRWCSCQKYGTLVPKAFGYKSPSMCEVKQEKPFRASQVFKIGPLAGGEFHLRNMGWMAQERIAPRSLGEVNRAIMLELVNNGPLVASFQVCDDFHEHKEGIYYHGSEDRDGCGGHAVELIGYGEEQGRKFWIAKNSWGVSAHVGGYFKIARGVNHLGIESKVVGATVVQTRGLESDVIRGWSYAPGLSSQPVKMYAKVVNRRLKELSFLITCVPECDLFVITDYTMDGHEYVRDSDSQVHTLECSDPQGSDSRAECILSDLPQVKRVISSNARPPCAPTPLHMNSFLMEMNVGEDADRLFRFILGIQMRYGPMKDAQFAREMIIPLSTRSGKGPLSNGRAPSVGEIRAFGLDAFGLSFGTPQTEEGLVYDKMDWISKPGWGVYNPTAPSPNNPKHMWADGSQVDRGATQQNFVEDAHWTEGAPKGEGGNWGTASPPVPDALRPNGHGKKQVNGNTLRTATVDEVAKKKKAQREQAEERARQETAKKEEDTTTKSKKKVVKCLKTDSYLRCRLKKRGLI
uniref:Peptidase C1A papain C-terminal domain-containing protein n=1 Tax=Chromera velia CCMP2878 TaxID=1169474 RepID=A0A0G4GGZ6_9ALVE|eukprot:Cvel_21855.t1-p1 / transcript=Cvel_21855.t1 / gene=Cvel_21855 / organism=Chromera_velia_CCMP2878 / gene_product=Cathepsin B, putative / transcript_product=Cathepsin B, putative / location=Cvel_scaffold2088:21043-30596(+) / protein_length=1109 / sequence_SO=supercontig / SO=protein_coding / is_pseudo=false